MYPLPDYVGGLDNAEKRHLAALTATEFAQPALGACAVGLTKTLARFAITPKSVTGHSYGELVALHAAGVLMPSNV